jgi:elongation factor 2
MVPTSDKGTFLRLFDVCLSISLPGQKVRIMGANYVLGKKSELWIKNIQKRKFLIKIDVHRTGRRYPLL